MIIISPLTILGVIGKNAESIHVLSTSFRTAEVDEGDEHQPQRQLPAIN